MGGHIQYNENHREVQGLLEKKCDICKEWFPCTHEYFYANKMNSIDGLHPWCKNCSREKSRKRKRANREECLEIDKAYNQANKEELKIYKKGYRKNNVEKRMDYQRGWVSREGNREKTREYAKNHRNHDITNKEWKSELEVFDYSCAYCGITEKEHKNKYKERLHRDHADHEGYNDLRNAIPACKYCNCSKHDFDMEEWYRDQDFFNEEKLEFIKWWLLDGYKDYIEDKPPYRVLRERDEGLSTYHFNLWSVDEKRNTIEIIATGRKKKDLDEDILELA